MVKSTFKTLKLGGGGFVTGIDISPDGLTRLVRTDVGGAYIWDAVADRWDQLVAAPHIAADFPNGGGVWEIRSAPSDPTVVYMVFSSVMYKSVDCAATFAQQDGWPSVTIDPNITTNSSRLINAKMAVDPINADHVIVWTFTEGCYRTTDGGETWTQIATLPTTTDLPGTVCFDPTSAATGGLTSKVYVSSYGNGIFVSTDGGATFDAIAGGPGDTFGFFAAQVSATGVLFCMGDPNVAPYSPTLWRYDGAWTDITPADSGQCDGIATDPNNPSRLFFFNAGSAYVSLNADTTATWSALLGKTRDATGDVKWLDWTNENYMSSAGLIFDPVEADRIWFAQGIGVWYADVGSSVPASMAWKSRTRGIEELVVNQVFKPAGGGKVFVPVWDRQLFRTSDPDTYPSTHFPDNTFAAGWAIDGPPGDPDFLLLCKQWGGDLSVTSSDGGDTWDAMPGLMTRLSTLGLTTGEFWGGHFAVADRNNFIYVPGADYCIPQYTKDGGETWDSITLPSSPGSEGWGVAIYCHRRVCAVDRVTANKFYLYNYTTGLYVSEDGGDTWMLVNGNANLGALENSATAYHAKLRAVPGKAGHLFFTSGADGQASRFIRSKDGGATWTVCAGIRNVFAFGFGSAAPNQSYPAIYAFGEGGPSWEQGVWRSIDDGASWEKVVDYPLGIYDFVAWVEGDMDNYGVLYVGYSGTGAVIGSLEDSKGSRAFRRI